MKGAASMNVSVGYFCDPDGLAGLAHFLGECSVLSFLHLSSELAQRILAELLWMIGVVVLGLCL
jgi:hypothetical protein